MGVVKDGQESEEEERCVADERFLKKINILYATNCFWEKLPGSNANVFALGSKYDIPHLQTKALTKFKVAARLWSKDELIESIPIVFNTAPDNDSLRVAINAIITANSAQLTNDSAFEDAVNDIEGLAFQLFRLQTLHRGGQRTCLGCSVVYESKCAVQGCPREVFGGVERHICDKTGICTGCYNCA